MNLKMNKNINIASYIDHTILNPDKTNEDIYKLCKEAIEYKFSSVCVLPHYVAYCRNLLADTGVKVCTVIGFPLGATHTSIKIAEAETAIEDGAIELDMVINISALKNKDYKTVQEDIEAVTEFAHLNNAIVKVIVETCLLTLDEKIKICEIVSNAGADFIKTSTGFSTSGATIEDIELFRKHCSENVKIKASGGIRSNDFTIQLINAGADRIGTSSGIKIFNESRQ